MGGFIQRAEEMRRWAFGQMYVLNAVAPFAVKGMWLLRGQDIKPMLDSNPDAEYYTWCVAPRLLLRRHSCAAPG